MQWVADYGNTTACCQFATDDELREEPGRFRCATCAYADQWARVWPENREAWRIYKLLAGRVIREASLHGWMLAHLTAGWSSAAVVDLVARLTVIHDILAPEVSRHGRPGTDPEDYR